jgi:hypothetical protein
MPVFIASIYCHQAASCAIGFAFTVLSKCTHKENQLRIFAVRTNFLLKVIFQSRYIPFGPFCYEEISYEGLLYIKFLLILQNQNFVQSSSDTERDSG